MAGFIGGVIGLSTVAEAHPQLRPGPSPSIVAGAGSAATAGPSLSPHAGPSACPAARAAAGGSAWTADQLASTYGFSTLFGQDRVGAGQQVGILELEPFTASDIATYQACFGSTASVSTDDVDGGATGPQIGEAALDVEVVAGLAPSSDITVFSGPNAGTGPIDAYSAMVNDHSINVLTTSWGQCEGPVAEGGIDPAQQRMETVLFQEAAAQGQTMMAAAGDSGSSDCYNPPDSTDQRLWVDDPADQPDVTGVGGTSLTGEVSTPSTETVWNDGTNVGSGGGAGGGGSSADFAAPSWQQGYETNDTCGASGTLPCRVVPDVSASSDPDHGDVIFFGGRWTIFGGTSAAAPLWAALTAVTNQGCATPAGFLNPRLYAAGAGPSPPFNDITHGNNNLFGQSEYPAAPATTWLRGGGPPRAGGLMTLLSGSSAGCPSVTGLSPNAGPATGGRTVVISGSGFGTGVPTVRFGGITVGVDAHTPTR